MGAGAGYKVTIKNSRVGNITISNVVLEKDTSGKEFFHWCNVDVTGDIQVVGDVKIESYGYGCDFVSDVPMTCTHCNIDLDIGNGYNDQILTTEAITKYEEMFGIPVNDMYKELIEVINLEDIRPEYIEECIRDSSFDGDARLGGGWVGSTFDGIIEELDTSVNNNSYQYVDSADLIINNKFVIEFLDKAKYGDNIEYTAFYNGEVLDVYETLDEAIEALKKEISEDISATDPSECFVESSYYYITDFNDNECEYESNWDDAYVEYTAEEDFGDEVYDALDELDEENNPDIDEGFEI